MNLEKKYTLELAIILIQKIAPLETEVFPVFEEQYLQENFDFTNKKEKNILLGFGIGSEPTFISPWIIYVISECVIFFRELLTGILVDEISKKGDKQITKNFITPELLKKLKTIVYETLHSKGMSGRKSRIIADEIIETLLFDEKARTVLYKMIVNSDIGGQVD